MLLEYIQLEIIMLVSLILVKPYPTHKIGKLREDNSLVLTIRRAAGLVQNLEHLSDFGCRYNSAHLVAHLHLGFFLFLIALLELPDKIGRVHLQEDTHRHNLVLIECSTALRTSLLPRARRVHIGYHRG